MPLNQQLIQLVAPVLPADYCLVSYQRFAIDLFTQAGAIFRSDIGNSFFNMGSATPTAENRIFPWLNTNDGRWYWWNTSVGLWTSPMDPSARELTFRKLWKPVAGTLESALWALDGGDGADPATSPPDAYTGASWEVDHDLDGRMLVGAGAVPGNSPALTLAVGSSGGEGTHALTKPEMPPHVHEFTVIAKNSGASGSGVLTGGDNNNANDGEFTGDTENAGGDSATPPAVVPHNNLPPYWAGFYIKPTARRFYVLPG